MQEYMYITETWRKLVIKTGQYLRLQCFLLLAMKKWPTNGYNLSFRCLQMSLEYCNIYLFPLILIIAWQKPLRKSETWFLAGHMTSTSDLMSTLWRVPMTSSTEVTWLHKQVTWHHKQVTWSIVSMGIGEFNNGETRWKTHSSFWDKKVGIKLSGTFCLLH